MQGDKPAFSGAFGGNRQCSGESGSWGVRWKLGCSPEAGVFAGSWGVRRKLGCSPEAGVFAGGLGVCKSHPEGCRRRLAELSAAVATEARRGKKKYTL